MRKIEIGLGIAAGFIGILMAVLSLFYILPYSQHDVFLSHEPQDIQMYATVLIVANVVGVAGAVMVKWHNLAGSIMMLVGTLVALVFGFPWQTVSAVMYIISIVLAMVPVKYEEG